MMSMTLEDGCTAQNLHAELANYKYAVKVSHTLITACPVLTLTGSVRSDNYYYCALRPDHTGGQGFKPFQLLLLLILAVLTCQAELHTLTYTVYPTAPPMFQ